MDIKNKIIDIIKDNPAIGYHGILSRLNSDDEGIFKDIVAKKLLGEELILLEREFQVTQINNKYYHLDRFENKVGFVGWNLSGASYLTATPLSNDYGMLFSSSDKVVVVNKSLAELRSECLYKVIPIDDNGDVVTDQLAKSYLGIITKKIKTDNCKILIQKINDKYTILNNYSVIDDLSILPAPVIEMNDRDIVEAYKSSDLDNITYIKKVGNLADVGIENKIAKTLSDLVSYYDGIYKINNKIDLSSDANTSDLTNLDFVTIDSITTRDIDDAICVKKLSNGYSVKVAIADVDRYVNKGADLDLVASQSATTYYLPNETINMLPRELSEGECSLNIGSPKKVLVADIYLNNTGEITDYSFYRAIIKSAARLTYVDVDAIFSDKDFAESLFSVDGSVFKSDNVSKSHKNTMVDYLKVFNEVSLVLEAKIAKNTTEYRQVPEINFNSDGKIESLYYFKELGVGQRIVEQLMLLANKVAAEYVYKNYPQIGIFRNQLAPMGDLAVLKSAYYKNINEGHYGLNSEYYTHFTSPIRRYCDLVVHRIIKNIIDGTTRSYSDSELLSIAGHINDQNLKSKQVNLKIRNCLINEYIERLNNNNELDKTLVPIEVKENGVVFINSQLIEFYMPKFKLGHDVLKKLKYKFGVDSDDYPAQLAYLIENFNFSFNVKEITPTSLRKEIDMCVSRNHSPRPSNVVQI